ncbi:endopeptidase, putative [Plasmodium sp. gorilla clade G2]|uniref:endopeptidase, putative n=1 Tax=Plasmodium sp. gorilla clade G2 TaxID=880535 RepID=UPI000D2008D5|nr:endopeptidase, putative [Plasmodium sp. gorilla clade G2]SOV18006.1 endopeptidase, putative [Plasmodium sp. gorilla clade G2]
MNHISYKLRGIKCYRTHLKGTIFKRNYFWEKVNRECGLYKIWNKLNLKNIVKKNCNKLLIHNKKEDIYNNNNIKSENIVSSCFYEYINSTDILNNDEKNKIDKMLEDINRRNKEIGGYLLELNGIHNNGDGIIKSSHACIRSCDNILSKICKEENIFKIINMVDTVSNNLCKLGDVLELLRNLHNNKNVIGKAHEALEKLTNYIDKINIDTDIYNFLKKKYNENIHLLNHEHKEVLHNMIVSMENQGVHIKDPKEREKYLELQSQEKYFAFHASSNYCDEFNGIYIEKNKLLKYINEKCLKDYEDKLIPYIKNNQIKIQKNYPLKEYIYILQDSSFLMTILKNVNDNEIINKVYTLLKEPNLTFLNNILILQYYRNKLINYRNFNNYNEYSLKDCILNEPNRVNYFLKNFLHKILPYFFKELEFIESYISIISLRNKEKCVKIIKENKQNDNYNDEIPKLNASNIYYYMNEIKKVRLKNIDTEMKNNLTLYDVIKFVITLLKNSYSLEMVNVNPLKNELWDENIIKFEIKRGPYIYGYIYMDLFERENKNNSIAQYTVRCSKNMNYPLKYKWLEENYDQCSFVYTGIVKDEYYKNDNKKTKNEHNTQINDKINNNNYYYHNGDNTYEYANSKNNNNLNNKYENNSLFNSSYRQTTSTFLVCNFNVINICDKEKDTNYESYHNDDNLFLNKNISFLLEKINMSIDKVNIFLHEFGHTLHCILSSTYLQHLSGNRSGVDFSEFSSHFFEEYLNCYDALLLLYNNNNKKNKNNEEYMKSLLSNYMENKNIICYYSILQLTIQSIIDQIFYSFSSNSNNMIERKESIERKIKSYFEGIYYKDIHILDLFPQIHFSKTTHLVHYPSNYYSYLYCSVLAKYIWNMTFKDNLFNMEKADKIVNFLQKGSVDSSLRNIISLVENDQSKIDYYTENPHKIPLNYFLDYYQENKEDKYASFLNSI